MSNDTNRDLTKLRPISRALGAGPAVDVLGVTHVYKAMADDTGHQFSIWESIVPPGHGAPAHTHMREDEAFYVLGGEVLFEVEGAAAPLRLGAGAFLFGPRDVRQGTAIATPAKSRRTCWSSRCPAAASIACSQPSTKPANAPDKDLISRPLPRLPRSMES